jgi:diadenosine tetraphosphate (Ap4A) HIT family hydrolase
MAAGDELAFFADYSFLNGCKPLLDETENLILIPDIAPLCEDHLLLITKPHIPSFAALPEIYQSESQAILQRTLARMKKFHPTAELFVFEHGVGYIEGQTIRCGACSRTDHAHLHLLPLPRTREHGVAEILAEQIAQDFPLKLKMAPPIPSLSLKTETGEYPYLLFWSSLDFDKTYLLVQDSLDYTIPSQVIRRLLALQSLGLRNDDTDRWDWRNLVDLYPKEMENMVRSTIQRWCS